MDIPYFIIVFFEGWTIKHELHFLMCISQTILRLQCGHRFINTQAHTYSDRPTHAHTHEAFSCRGESDWRRWLTPWDGPPINQCSRDGLLLAPPPRPPPSSPSPAPPLSPPSPRPRCFCPHKLCPVLCMWCGCAHCPLPPSPCLIVPITITLLAQKYRWHICHLLWRKAAPEGLELGGRRGGGERGEGGGGGHSAPQTHAHRASLSLWLECMEGHKTGWLHCVSPCPAIWREGAGGGGRGNFWRDEGEECVCVCCRVSASSC